MKSPREALQPEAAPPPPAPERRKRGSLVSVISGILSFIIVGFVVVGIGWSFFSKKVQSPGPLTAEKTVSIPRGDDVEVTLEENGVIESALLMKAALLLEHNKANVKAGEYLFKQNASLQDVIDTLVSGKPVLHALTIPEGLTSQQIIERMRDNDILVGDIKTVPAEGSLMPDTYKFARGTTRDQLVKTMQLEERKVVADVWAKRASDIPLRSPYELVTLASIVEKETGKPDERPRVAGVFVNRLSKNIPLQSDPTIVYGIVGGKGTLGRGILKSEVDQKTPYNTYAIAGLPPGPIANPGRAALEAVANPLKTRELYFVADGTGGHAFAETLDQHKANVVRWRQIEKDAKDKLAPDAGVPAGSTQPARTNQRGDAGGVGQVFGMINQFGAGPAAVPSRGPDRFSAFPLSFSMGTRFQTPSPGELKSKPGAALAYGNAPLDDLDIEVDGVRSKDVPVADMPADDAAAAGANLMTFPVAAGRQAEMKARAAEYGLPAAAGGTGDAQAALMTPPPSAVAPNGRTRIYDASEGTALDPLRDRTYDLMTAKSVPVIKALPPMPVSSYR